MSKFDKDLKEVGFSVETKNLKNKTTNVLIDLINNRHDLLEKIQKEFSQELVEGIKNSNDTIMAFALHNEIAFDQKVAFDRINNIVTHIIKEHAMSKNTKKQEVKATKPAKKEQAEVRAVREEKPVAKKQEAAPKAQPKKAAKAPEKPLSVPAPEPEAEKAASAPAEFKTPCGGIFDADPSSSCFGMCHDESPEDFELCMAHYKSALEQKTTKRRVAAKKTAEKKTTGEKKAPKLYDRIGDGFGTSAHMINILLLEGATLEEIMDVVPTEKTRVMGHLSGLKSGNSRRGPKVVIKDPTTKRYYLDFEEGEPVTYFTII